MTNDKQRVDFPVGENVREDKRGTPRGRLVELFEQLEDPSLTCPRMGTNARCGGCKYLKRDGCDLTGRFVDYFLANGVIVPPCKVGDTVYQIQPTRNRVQAYEVTSYKFNGRSYFFSWVLKDRKGFYENVEGFSDIQIGKTVFLTKEEAEQALNNIQNGNSCEGGVQV